MPVLCMRKAVFDLKTKAIVSFTTRTAANVHTECLTNLNICVPPHTLNRSSATSQERDLYFVLHDKQETAWRDQRFLKNGSEVMGCWMT